MSQLPSLPTIDARLVELNLYQTTLDKVGTRVVFNISMLGGLA